MKPYLIKIYFKGGVLVPFYFSCFLSFLFFSVAFVAADYKISAVANNWVIQEILKITLYSGLTGLCSLTAFLNSYPKIANNLAYSVISWFLLPYACIAFILAKQIDWEVYKTDKGAMLLSILYFITFFLHFIGLIIGYQSFRATVVINKNDKEVMNVPDDEGLLLNSDKTVQVSDPSLAGRSTTEVQ
jgi:hypothetical protein